MSLVERENPVEAPTLSPYTKRSMHLNFFPFGKKRQGFIKRRDWTTFRWYTAMPLIALVLFALLMTALLLYVNHSEKLQRQQALYRDIESAQQLLRVRLRDHIDQLSLHANDLSLPGSFEDTRGATIRDLLLANPAINYIAWVDRERNVKMALVNSGITLQGNRRPDTRLEDSSGFAAFLETSRNRVPTYSEPFIGENSEMLFELHVPIVWQGKFEGSLVAGYSAIRLLEKVVSPNTLANYQLDLLDQGGNALASTAKRRLHETNLRYEVPLDPPGHGMRLRGYAFDAEGSGIYRSLVITVTGLSLAIAASLLALWRYASSRSAAEEERDRLFALSADVLCVLDSTGQFVRVNPAFEQLFGDKVGPIRVQDIIHPEHSERFLAALESAALPAGSHIETRCIAASSAIEWLDWSLRGERRSHAGAKAKGLVYAVAHDVTQRKRTEQALAAETSFRRAMEDSMLTGMRAFDNEGKITYVNRAFCQMIGYSEHELLGKVAPFPYWPQGRQAEHSENLRTILSGKAPSSGIETQVQRRDGSLIFARMYVSPLVDSNGKQNGWMTSMTDITEPKRIREQLAAAQEQLSAVLDQLDAAVCVVAPSLNHPTPDLLLTNRVYRTAFQAQNLPWPNDALAALEALGPLQALELFHDASQRWYELRVRPIQWVDGQEVSLLVCSDVTQTRQVRDYQRIQEEKLQQTSRLVTMGEMASSLAHELNQPLTAISNYTMGSTARVQALQETAHNSEAQRITAELMDAMNKTAKQAQRAGQVVRRIRDFVKRSEPQRSLCNIPELIADALGLADIEAQRNGVVIQTDIAPDLPELSVDRILIEQVLLNLLKNAMDSMQTVQEKRLFVKASLVNNDAPGVEIMVQDGGVGLKGIEPAQLFEPFYTTKREGMGMGLNICRSIVESHHGRLWVEANEPNEANKSGQGCQFKFSLPLTPR